MAEQASNVAGGNDKLKRSASSQPEASPRKRARQDRAQSAAANQEPALPRRSNQRQSTALSTRASASARRQRAASAASAEFRGRKRQAEIETESQRKYPLRSQFRVTPEGALVPLSSALQKRNPSETERAESSTRKSEPAPRKAETAAKKPETVTKRAETAPRKSEISSKRSETSVSSKTATKVSKKSETTTSKKWEAPSKKPETTTKKSESATKKSLESSSRKSEGAKAGRKSKGSKAAAAEAAGGGDTEAGSGVALTTGSCASSSRRSSRAAKLPLDAPGMSANPTGAAGAASTTDHSDQAASADPAPQPNSQQQPSASGLGAVGGAAAGAAGTSADSESDDGEVGRLQALLEARGLPPHLFGALGPRMQTLLHRSMGNSSSSKAQQLLQGLQASGDEGQQLQAVIEMCQMLVMGNEDTLAGFPVKQVVPALVTLLGMEHNFDMMNHACRALTYMMEALPRSSAVVVDAVPVFLEKLQVIQCMDVAEQALTALEMLSRRHSKHILQARGVAACLMYLDFFSINAQRAALAVTANCCQNLHADEFHFLGKSLGLLADRLALQDKKSVESVCLAFSRLVDSFQHEPAKLVEIASPELLANLQQLLVVAPPVVSTGTFITALRMLSVMCANCPELALTLLRQNIAQTLCCLLTGAVSNAVDTEVELVARSPQELYEITSLIGELMPRLPSDGIFSVDALLDRPGAPTQDTVQWQWRDDRGLWHPYTTMDSRVMEAAHQGGEDEASLSTLGRAYTVDFHSMQQINEDTGTTRPVQRRLNPASLATNMADLLAAAAPPPPPPPPAAIGAGGPTGTEERTLAPTTTGGVRRSGCAREERCLAASFIRALFSTLYEVYSSSAGPAVRCKCLRALLRMVYLASPDLLKEVLKNQVVSSHIAGMMASQDLRIVVGALQMADILMQKLPEVFAIHFTREGVMHQIAQLADPEVPLAASPPKNSCVKSEPSTSGAADAPHGPATPGTTVSVGNGSEAPDAPAPPEDVKPSSASQLLGDVLKRKRTPKRGLTARKTRQDDSLAQELLNKAPAASRSRFSGSKTSSFLASLNPARWGRGPGPGLLDNPYKTDGANAGLSKSGSSPSLTAGNREKARAWVRDQAARFVEQHAAAPSSGASRSVLSRLTQAITRLQLEDEECVPALRELRGVVLESDISPFEVNHSGLVRALLTFVAGPGERRRRLRALLHVFAACPMDEEAAIVEPKPAPLSALVLKLGGCVSQLEQFPVKVHDLPAGAGGRGGGGGTSALKFFNTHQLKCNLQRHPDCSSLRQWKGGTVKIDPLALVQAIERYLVVRGYARLKDKESGDSDDDNSEEDIDDTLAAVVISQGAARHRLQFLINGQVLPYNMTVYQAVRQFAGADASETDTDNEAPLGNSGVWVHTHTIQYRPVEDDPPPGTARPGPSGGAGGRKGKGPGGGKAPRARKPDSLWTDGVAPLAACPLESLSPRLPDSVTVADASLEALTLLRCLHSVTRHWGRLYQRWGATPLVPASEFVSSKLAAKASRQLQDPLVIMTGNLPCWLQQVAHACPFLFPFETRQLLFYATVFDRDRALQRLLDSAPELSTADTAERVTPRLERRKRVISRQDVLKQAEHLMHELASSRALLEVQYHDEVGTGLGPTLEFYALVSREMQRLDLELWHPGDNVVVATASAATAASPASSNGLAEGDAPPAYVDSPTGLFPAPLGRQAKSAAVARAKAKFRFLGKFMAKAVMDSRMLDLPLSVSFYRWLLGQETALGLSDLSQVVPAVHATLARLADIGRQRQRIERRTDLTPPQRKALADALTLDGCPLDQLGLDFTLPGHPGIELRKGGREVTLTPHNVDQYVALVVHWYLREGVSRQLEALREGFESVFPAAALRMFGPEELEAVFCGSTPAAAWDPRTLAECCRPDHGFTHESRAIRFLYEILSHYDAIEQRLFTQFVTGSPRLPVGGFKSLSPPLTVVRKTLELNMDPDDFLPSVMTCVNYLKLPDYTSLEVMRAKLSLAAREGQHSFHLS